MDIKDNYSVEEYTALLQFKNPSLFDVVKLNSDFIYEDYDVQYNNLKEFNNNKELFKLCYSDKKVW